MGLASRLIRFGLVQPTAYPACDSAVPLNPSKHQQWAWLTRRGTWRTCVLQGLPGVGLGARVCFPAYPAWDLAHLCASGKAKSDARQLESKRSGSKIPIKCAEAYTFLAFSSFLMITRAVGHGHRRNRVPKQVFDSGKEFGEAGLAPRCIAEIMI